jgi:hypothetical protein
MPWIKKFLEAILKIQDFVKSLDQEMSKNQEVPSDYDGCYPRKYNTSLH